MVIFTVPYISCELKPIPVPRAKVPQIISLLKEKKDAGIIEPSFGPYSNRWFTVLKKDGKLRFIQDMQPLNKVTVRNMAVGPDVDELAESFSGRAIYSTGDLLSGYDQFQLSSSSRDMTSIRTPLGLMRMCTAPQGATNSVAHVSNAMNKIFCDFIPEIVYPFIDDLPIKGCAMVEKKSFYVKNGVRKFVYDHLQHVDSVLKRLIEVRLTLSAEKSKFAVPEIKVVGQICGTYGRKPCANNVLGIVNLQPCKDQHEVRRFLGACSFYRIWIPHYAHVAEPLYQLLRKQNIFKWTEECQDAQDSLKNSLMSDPIYGVKERPLTLTVDTSPTAIGWVLGQNDESGHRYASRYGAKVFNQRQRNYAQVKRELWGLYTALKVERVHVIGSLLIIETDCKPLLGMVTNSDTHDIAMLRWISYIRTFDATIIHISGKLNHMADMLSRAKLKRENEPEETSVAQKSKIYAAVTHVVEIPNEEVPFQEDEYEGDLQKLGLFICNRYKTKNAVDERNIKRIAQKYFLKNGQLWKKL